MSFCKLRYLRFSFRSFPKEWRSVLKKQARALYNNAITRKRINQQKAFLYFQELDQKIAKQAKLNRTKRIKDFLVGLGHMGKEDILTNARMQSALSLLKSKGHYKGEFNLKTRNKYLAVFEKHIMNINFTKSQ